MKKIGIVFHPHSFVDVITNSSSELFIGKAKKDVETIRELLNEMLDLHNKVNDTDYSFDDVFSTIDNVENVDSVLQTFVSFGIPYTVSEIFEKYEKPPHYSSTEDWSELVKKEKEWIASISQEDRDKLSEYVIIESASDNSIPYDLFDSIESLVNGERIHLG